VFRRFSARRAKRFEAQHQETDVTPAHRQAVATPTSRNEVRTGIKRASPARRTGRKSAAVFARQRYMTAPYMRRGREITERQHSLRLRECMKSSPSGVGRMSPAPPSEKALCCEEERTEGGVESAAP